MTHSAEDLGRTIIFLQDEKREVNIDLSRYEGAMIKHLQDCGLKSIVIDDVRFTRRHSRVATTPSKRRHWRAMRPQGALDQFHQPEYLEVTRLHSAVRRSA